MSNKNKMVRSGGFKGVKRRSSLEQAIQIRDEALSLIEQANSHVPAIRQVTAASALEVIWRSLNETRSLTFSARRNYALDELCSFIDLAQGNLNYYTIKKHSDLLNTAHPYSAAPHAMTADARNKAQMQWYMADPIVTEETAPLLASAFAPETDETTRTYVLTRLTASAEGLRALEALTAAFSGDGNSYFERRMRAMRQRRDRLGRFAEEGGGMRALLRLADGSVHWLTGRSVGADPNSNTFDVETPRGIVRIPAGSVEGIEAYLPGGEDSNGVSKVPAKISSADSTDVLNESDIKLVDAPSGWEPVENFKGNQGEKAFTDGTYTVAQLKGEDGKNAYRLIDENGAEVSQGDSWAKMLDDSMTDALGTTNRPQIPQDVVLSGLDEIANNETAGSFREVAKKISDYLKTGNLPEGETAQSLADRSKRIADALAGDKGKAPEDRLFEKKFQGFEDDFRKGADAINAKLEGPARQEQRKEEQGKPVARIPNEAPMRAEEITVPQGAYEVDRGEYTPEGHTEQDSQDYTDDPKRLANKFSAETIAKALQAAILGTNPNEVNGSGSGPLEFDSGNEYVPAEALFHALKEHGKNAGKFVDGLYKKGHERLANKNEEPVANLPEEPNAPEVSPEEKAIAAEPIKGEDVAESLDRVIKTPEISEVKPLDGDGVADDDHDKTDDLAPDSQEEVPALIEGLTEEERQAWADNGFDHTPYLPANEDIQLPDGYHQMDSAPYALDNITTVEEGDALNEAGVPVGWTDDPYFMARDYNTQDLVDSLQFALEPRDEDSEYDAGMAPISVTDENGEDVTVQVPAEAIRDALQLQGEDTNEILQRFADDAFASLADQGEIAPDVKDGQSSDDLSDEEMRRMMEGEGISSEEEPSISKSIMDRLAEMPEGGGLTIDPLDGSEPDTGIVVAQQGTNKEFNYDDFMGQNGREYIDQYIEDNLDALSAEGVYLGFWHDEANNEMVLDVVDVINNEEEAIQAGIDRNQQKIYDIGNERLIDTGGTGDRQAEQQENIPSESPEESKGNDTGGTPGVGVQPTRETGGEEPAQRVTFTPSDTRQTIPYDTLTWDDAQGKAIPSSGESQIVDFGGRKIVVMDINGTKIPFYISTGSGGKKDVAAGKWYPFFGIGEDGWINKTSGADINNYYNSPELKAQAEWLDANIGDIRDDNTIPKVKGTGSHIDFINQDLNPAENGTRTTIEDVKKNIEDTKAKLAPSQPSAVDKGAFPETPEEPSAPVTDEQTATRAITWTPPKHLAPSSEFIDHIAPDTLVNPEEWMDPADVPAGSSDWRLSDAEVVDDGEGGFEVRASLTYTNADGELDMESVTTPYNPNGYTTYEERRPNPTAWEQPKTSTPTADSYVRDFTKPVMFDGSGLVEFEKKMKAGSESIKKAISDAFGEDYANELYDKAEKNLLSDKEKQKAFEAAQDEAPSWWTPYGDNLPTEEDLYPTPPTPPAKMFRGDIATKDLQPGDVTVGDNFTIVSVGTEPITEFNGQTLSSPRLLVRGYFPGHAIQEKPWNPDTEIPVVRGIAPDQLPTSGDLPELHKPSFRGLRGGRNNKDFLLEYAKWRGALNAARDRWSGKPDAAKKDFNPETDTHRVKLNAQDLKPGDVSADPSKGHFVITSVSQPDPNNPDHAKAIELGQLIVSGYYPGHEIQEKKWFPTQRYPMEFVRNGVVPDSGPLPKINQPSTTDENGNYVRLRDPQLLREYKRKIAEASSGYTLPENAPLVDSAQAQSDVNPNVTPTTPTPDAPLSSPSVPRSPSDPFAQGSFADLVREAGSWSALKEALKGKTLVFFDYETTGFGKNGEKNNPVQLGAVKVVDGVVVDRFNVHMNPETELTDWSKKNLVDSEGNPLTDEWLAGQIGMADAHQQFADWVGADAILGAHNTAFDRPVLDRILNSTGVEMSPAGYIDTLTMAREIHKNDPNSPSDGNSLKSLSTHYNLGLDGGWHTADADSEATSKLFSTLIDHAEANNLGNNLFNVDENQLAHEQASDRYLERYMQYVNDLSAYEAQQLILKAAAGEEVNIDDAVKNIQGAKPEANPDEVDVPSTGEVAEAPQRDSRLATTEWATSDENTREIPMGDIRFSDIQPNDFMTSLNGNMYQVLDTNDDPDFVKSQGGRPGQSAVYRVSLETGEGHWFCQYANSRQVSGVRRPINPDSLNFGDNSGDQSLTKTISTSDVKPDAPSIINHEDSNSEFNAETTVSKNPDGSMTASTEVFDGDGDTVSVEEKQVSSMEEAQNFGDSTVDDVRAEIADLTRQFEEMAAKDKPTTESVPEPLRDVRNPTVLDTKSGHDQNGTLHEVTVSQLPNRQGGGFEVALFVDNGKGDWVESDSPNNFARYETVGEANVAARKMLESIKPVEKKPAPKPAKSVQDKMDAERAKIQEGAYLRVEYVKADDGRGGLDVVDEIHYWRNPDGSTVPYNPNDPVQGKDTTDGRVFGEENTKVLDNKPEELDSALAEADLSQGEEEELGDEPTFFEPGVPINGLTLLEGGTIIAPERVTAPDGTDYDVAVQLLPRADGSPENYQIVTVDPNNPSIRVISTRAATLDEAKALHADTLRGLADGSIEITTDPNAGRDVTDVTLGDSSPYTTSALMPNMGAMRRRIIGDERFRKWQEDNNIYGDGVNQARLGDRVVHTYDGWNRRGEGTILGFTRIHNSGDRNREAYAIVTFEDGSYALWSTRMLFLNGRTQGVENRTDYTPPEQPGIRPFLDPERKQHYALTNKYKVERRKRRAAQGGGWYAKVLPYISKNSGTEIADTRRAHQMWTEMLDGINDYRRAHGLPVVSASEIKVVPPSANSQDGRGRTWLRMLNGERDGGPTQFPNPNQTPAPTPTPTPARQQATPPSTEQFAKSIENAFLNAGITFEGGISEFDADEKYIDMVNVKNDKEYRILVEPEGIIISQVKNGEDDRRVWSGTNPSNALAKIVDLFGGNNNGGNRGTPTPTPTPTASTPSYPQRGGLFTKENYDAFHEDIKNTLSENGIEGSVVNYGGSPQFAGEVPDSQVGTTTTVMLPSLDTIIVKSDKDGFTIIDSQTGEATRSTTTAANALAEISRLAKRYDSSEPTPAPNSPEERQAETNQFVLDFNDSTQNYANGLSAQKDEDAIRIVDEYHSNGARIDWSDRAQGYQTQVFINGTGGEVKYFADLEDASNEVRDALLKARTNNSGGGNGGTPPTPPTPSAPSAPEAPENPEEPLVAPGLENLPQNPRTLAQRFIDRALTRVRSVTEATGNGTVPGINYDNIDNVDENAVKNKDGKLLTAKDFIDKNWRPRKAAQIALAGRSRPSADRIRALVLASEDQNALRQDRMDAKKALQEELNKVYGGGVKFGDYTLEVSSVSASVNTWSTDENRGKISIALTFDLKDSRGYSTGSTIHRGLYFNPDGTLQRADNTHLKLYGNAKGSGFATSFNAHMENWYIANGAEAVTVHAFSNGGGYIGGYIWALNGFNWAHEAEGYRMARKAVESALSSRDAKAIEDAKKLQQKIFNLYNVNTWDEVRTATSNSNGVPAKFPTPKEIAFIGWQPDKENWWGQKFLKTSAGNWNGSKHLNPLSSTNIQDEAYEQIRIARGMVKRGENSVVPSTWVKKLFSSVDTYTSPDGAIITPYADELSNVFKGRNARSVSLLSPPAKQALGKYISTVLGNGSYLDSANTARARNANEANTQMLIDIMDALNKDKIAYQPNPTKLNSRGKELSQVPKSAFTDITGKNVPLVINGKDTGFTVTRLGYDAPNNENATDATVVGPLAGGSATWQVKDAQSGEVFYVKNVDDYGDASSEIAVNALGRALEIQGLPIIEGSATDPELVISSQAGAHISSSKLAKNTLTPVVTSSGDTLYPQADTSYLVRAGESGLFTDADKAASVVSMNGLANMAILDLVSLNEDRNENNTLMARDFNNKNPDGSSTNNKSEGWIPIPIDHTETIISDPRREKPNSTEEYIVNSYGDSMSWMTGLYDRLGPVAFKMLMDKRANVALENLREQYGPYMDEKAYEKFSERLQELVSFSADDWTNVIAKRKIKMKRDK